jgi:hypothetical protein
LVASYVAPPPTRPQRARKLRIRARSSAFAVSFSPPAGAIRTLVLIIATDGRRLQKVLPIHVRKLSVPVIGFSDGIMVTVVGIDPNGRRGPAARTSARRKT